MISVNGAIELAKSYGIDEDFVKKAFNHLNISKPAIVAFAAEYFWKKFGVKDLEELSHKVYEMTQEERNDYEKLVIAGLDNKIHRRQAVNTVMKELGRDVHDNAIPFIAELALKLL